MRFFQQRRLDWISRSVFALLAAIPISIATLGLGWLPTLGFFAATIVFALSSARRGIDLDQTVPLQYFDAPGLFELTQELAHSAGLRRLPEIRIVASPSLNAAATLHRGRSIVLLTEGLLNAMDARKIRAVLAHEIAHLRSGDLVAFRWATVVLSSTYALAILIVALALLVVRYDFSSALFWTLVGSLSIPAARSLLALFSRTREFAADMFAASLTGDAIALADALYQIEYRPRSVWEWIVGSHVNDESKRTGFRSHPSTRSRIQRLVAIARLQNADPELLPSLRVTMR